MSEISKDEASRLFDRWKPAQKIPRIVAIHRDENIRYSYSLMLQFGDCNMHRLSIPNGVRLLNTSESYQFADVISIDAVIEDVYTTGLIEKVHKANPDVKFILRGDDEYPRQVRDMMEVLRQAQVRFGYLPYTATMEEVRGLVEKLIAK